MAIELDKIKLAKAVLEIYKDYNSDYNSPYYQIAECAFCNMTTVKKEDWHDHEKIIHADECPVRIAKETVKDISGLEIREI
jgi:hypothetical protein